MTVAEYIVSFLICHNVTDAFGVPGGVILELIYAMEKRKDELTPHLNYSEQTAGFAACGYAQASAQLGVAYATRGPGISNMVTCMAEAYQESIPVLFMTAHENRQEKKNLPMRFRYNQELDLSESVSEFTKFTCVVDSIYGVVEALNEAYVSAMSGRKGPVFLDFSAALLKQEFDPLIMAPLSKFDLRRDSLGLQALMGDLNQALLHAKRPVFLIGDGIRQADACGRITVLDRFHIPILSSRGAQDIAAGSEFYFGYIGSHGIRYSNFILSKADLIVSVGNRLAFPMNSKSFQPIGNNVKIIRIDIDDAEFQRDFPLATNYAMDLCSFFDALENLDEVYSSHKCWVDTCRMIKEKLNNCDITEPVKRIVTILETCRDKNMCYVSDVGNNEFWMARAFEYVRPKGLLICSKSFGTLGSALGRAIGIYYATHRPTICVVGDQGFQCNIQELQFISQWHLPITILLLNNSCSGMIRDHESRLYQSYVHVTCENGYCVPDFSLIAKGYDIKFVRHYEDWRKGDYEKKPLIYEIEFDAEIMLSPDLPKGNSLQRMNPPIEEMLYLELNKL